MPLLGFVLCLLGSTLSIASDAGPSEDRYAAYWLVAVQPSSYQVLVLTRVPLSSLEAPCPQGSESILDCDAVWLETYDRTSIWNTDLRPIKPLDEVPRRRRGVVVFQDEKYRMEEAELDQVVSVLRYDSSTDIHRIFAPHAGQEEEIATLADRIEGQLGTGGPS